MEDNFSRDSLQLSRSEHTYTSLNRYFRQDSEFLLSGTENNNASAYTSFRRIDSKKENMQNGSMWLPHQRMKIRTHSCGNIHTKSVSEYPKLTERKHDIEFVHVHSFGSNIEERNSQDFEASGDMEYENKNLRRLSKLEDSLKLADHWREQNQLRINEMSQSDEDIDEEDYVMISDKVSVLQSLPEINLDLNNQSKSRYSTGIAKLSLPSKFLRRRIQAGRFPYQDYTFISEFRCSRHRISGIVATNGNVFSAIMDTTNIKVFDYHGNAIDTIDVKAEVDDLAICGDNNLYISCPGQKSIKVLNANLEVSKVVYLNKF